MQQYFIKSVTAQIDTATATLANITQITSAGNYKSSVRIHPSGSFVGYSEEYVMTGVARFYKLNAIRLSDLQNVKISPPQRIERDFDWFDAGSKVIFSSDRDDPKVSTSIYSGNFNFAASPPLQNISRVTQPNSATDFHPRISSDGACLAFIRNDGSIQYGPNDDLHIQDLLTNEVRRITSSRDISGVEWQP